MSKRARGLLAGVAVAALLAVAAMPRNVTAAGEARTISLYNIHTKETLTVLYKQDGRYIDSALAKINHILRDHRRNEETKMDPELVDLVWEMHRELGSKEPVHIISGYRSRATNEQLRRTVGGQASQSRHILGKAVDVHFPDVPLKHLRYSALVRERGGVGYYPTSAIPFVHVDTDRVRSWPRLPRHELALLFPRGTSQHQPSDGGPISKEDVRVAQARHRELAQQIAAFHAHPAAGVAVASAKPVVPAGPVQQVALLSPPASAPALVEAPRAVAPARPPAVPSPHDRARLSELFARASMGPQLLSGPVPARRPTPALPSLSGGPAAAPAALPKPPAAPAPQVAALDPAAVGAPTSDLGRFGWGGGWVAAPAFDEEHPEELSYRPFPIAPYLTATASEPLMSELLPHDVARTVDYIDQAAAIPPLRFRAGEQAARLLWAQQFTGQAVGLARLREAQAETPAGLASRPVRTVDKSGR